MSEWANLCGTDGKVKATLNRRTGELRIKDHGEIHHWNVIDLCRAGVVAPSQTSLMFAGTCSGTVDELLDGQTAY